MGNRDVADEIKRTGTIDLDSAIPAPPPTEPKTDVAEDRKRRLLYLLDDLRRSVDGGDRDAVDQVTRQIVEINREGDDLDLVGISAFMEANKVAPVAWLIDDLIPRGVPFVLGGAPKTGKTLLAINQALCLASGTPFLGKPTRQSRVLLVLLEDAPCEVSRRLDRLSHGLGLDPADMEGRIFLYTDPLRLDDPAHVGALKRAIDKNHLDLVVIDSLSKVHGGDENSVKEMNPVMDAWCGLARETGAAVGIVHHLVKNVEGRKSVGSRLRGSGNLFAQARWVVGIDRDEGSQIYRLSSEGNFPGGLQDGCYRILDGEDGEGNSTVTLDRVEGEKPARGGGSRFGRGRPGGKGEEA